MRCVGTARCMIKEEGFVRCDDLRIQDELDSVIDQIFIQVVAFFNRLGLGNGMVIVSQIREPLVGLTAQEAVVAFEAAPKRPTVEGAGRGALF